MSFDIQQAINAEEAKTYPGLVEIPDGEYTIINPLVISKEITLAGRSTSGVRITNLGFQKTALRLTAAPRVRLRNFTLMGQADSADGISVEGSSRVVMENLKIESHGGHGIIFTGGTWVIRMWGTKVSDCQGDGIIAVSEQDPVTGATIVNGNAMCLVGCSMLRNEGDGLRWGANSLSVQGCEVSNNKRAGVHLLTNGYGSTLGAHIAGNHFENNWEAQLDMTVHASNRLDGVFVAGNHFDGNDAEGAGESLVRATGAADKLRCFRLDHNQYGFGSKGNGNFYADLGGCPDDQSYVAMIDQQGEPVQRFTGLGQAVTGP
jgi:hypothetical protein